LDAALHPVPLEDILVGIDDHAGLQRNQRVRYLEGRGRQLVVAGTDLVAGDDQVVVDLVADERAVGTEVEEALCQIVAELAALVGDVGEAAGWNKCGGGKKTERVAAMDHGKTPELSWKAAGRCPRHHGETMTLLDAGRVFFTRTGIHFA